MLAYLGVPMNPLIAGLLFVLRGSCRDSPKSMMKRAPFLSLIKLCGFRSW